MQKQWLMQKAVEAKPSIYSEYHSFETLFVSNMSKYILRWPCSDKKTWPHVYTVDYTDNSEWDREEKEAFRGLWTRERAILKYPRQSIRPSLDMFPPVKILVTWKVAHTALWWEGNLRVTYHIIAMSLFGLLAYLKSFKEMGNAGGPRERYLGKLW